MEETAAHLMAGVCGAEGVTEGREREDQRLMRGWRKLGVGEKMGFPVL